MRNLVTVAALAAGVLLGVFIYTATMQPSEPSPILSQQFSWGFVSLGVDPATQSPKTDVTLYIAGVPTPVGTHAGTCFAVASSSWPLLSGEVSGAVCQWQDTGIEIGVFERGGRLSVEKGTVKGGDAATPGTRGDFKAIQK